MPQTRKQRKAAESKGKAKETPSPRTPASHCGATTAVRTSAGTPTPALTTGVTSIAGLKATQCTGTKLYIVDKVGSYIASKYTNEQLNHLTPDEKKTLNEQIATVSNDTRAIVEQRRSELFRHQQFAKILKRWPAFRWIYCHEWAEYFSAPHHLHGDRYVLWLAESGHKMEDPPLESIRAQTLLCASIYLALIEDMSIMSETSFFDVRRIVKTTNDATLFDLRERVWHDAACFKTSYEDEILGPDEEQEHDRVRDYPFSRRVWMEQTIDLHNSLVAMRAIIHAKITEDVDYQYQLGKWGAIDWTSWREGVMPQYRQIAAIRWSLIRANEYSSKAIESFEVDESLDIFEEFLAESSAIVDWLNDFDTNVYTHEDSDSDSDFIMPIPDASPSGKTNDLADSARGSVAPLFGKLHLSVRECPRVSSRIDLVNRA